MATSATDPLPVADVCLPWLLDDWQRLYRRHREGRLPHAILITGKPGIGKRHFARFLSRSLLCQQPTAEQGACGRCASCSQWQAEAHADFRSLAPDGGGQTIRIDAIRELIDWLHLTADRGSYKLALVESADVMTSSAANSLLKTLEEPGTAALIILVTDKPARLPSTVLSRCQLLNLRLQDRSVALTWLQDQVSDPQAALLRARGAPLQALREASAEWQSAEAALRKAWQDLFLHRASVERIVKSLEKLPTAHSLERFSHWTAAVVRRQADGASAGQSAIGGPAAAPASVSGPGGVADDSLASAVQHCMAPADWFALYDRLNQLYRIDSASFKAQLVLEGLFADIRRRCSSRTAALAGD